MRALLRPRVAGEPRRVLDVVLTICGRITSLQDVCAGSHSDTITATINW